MEITTYSSFRRNLKRFMDWVHDNSAPLYINRKNGDDMVLISKTEFDSIQETLHLLRSPRNAERLYEGIQEYESGGGEMKNLIE